VPFLDFLEFCPKLQPRFYTISSSSLVQPKQVSITVSLSTHHKQRGRVYHGIATTYLCGLKPGKDQVCVFLRPSTFDCRSQEKLRSKSQRILFCSCGSCVLTSPIPIAFPALPALPPVIMVGPELVWLHPSVHSGISILAGKELAFLS